MKIQFLLVCVIVWCNAGEGAFTSNYGYENRHDRVPIVKDGVPIDTPEVQAAKEAHFAAYARAKALAERQPTDGRYYVQQPQQQQQQYAIAAYSTDIQEDTPEVQHARAIHFATLAQIEQQQQQQQQYHHRARRGVYYNFDAPEETPEVQSAKLQHFIAHASVHDHEDEESENEVALEHGYHHIPIITKKGVPANTLEVKEARQQHLLAHHLAKSGEVYAGGYSHGIPVIAPNGVPYDTPEVFAAKIQHLQAHQKEAVRQHEVEGVYGGYGEYEHYGY